MGTNYNICDCKNKDLSTESHLAKIDGCTSQSTRNQTKQFLKSIPPKNNISFNSSKDINLIDLQRNGAVDKIIKNYRIYKSGKISFNPNDINSKENNSVKKQDEINDNEK